MLTVRELQGNTALWISPEAASLIKIYVSYFIQYPRFAYLRVGRFDGYPYKLPRYVDDKMVLIELCRQIGSLNKKCKDKRKPGIPFPIGLSHYNYKSFADA